LDKTNQPRSTNVCGYRFFSSPSIEPFNRVAFVHHFGTANLSGWKALKKRLSNSTASVMLAQEHKLVGKYKIEVASAWAAAKGWKSHWSSAELGAGGGPSGGTAIFIKEWLGTYSVEELGGVSDGRLCSAVLEFFSLTKLHLAYWKQSSKVH
jgi:hypothetical protein